MNDEHVKRTYVVEDQWKCGSCQEPNPGRFMKCQKCGAAKGKSEKDETDIEAAEVADEKLLAMAAGGENWVCTYCGSQDRTSDGKCRNCGASQADAKAKPKPGAPSSVNSESANPVVAVPPPNPSSGHTKLFIGLGVVGVLVAGVAYLVVPHQKAATVAKAHWTYTVDLEQRQLNHGSGFSPPGDAFNRSCQQRQNGTHDCDAYSCNPHSENYDCNPHDCNCHKESTSKKNGFSEVREVCSTCHDTCQRTVQSTCYHQCPTYAQWCSYDYYQWQKLGTKHAEGDTPDARWPDETTPGPEQRVQKHEQYDVAFDADGKQYAYSPKTLDEFQKYTRGASWKVKVNAAGVVWPEQPVR